MTAAEDLWLDLTRAQVLALTEVSIVGQYRVTAEQGQRLQHLMCRHPRAYTVRAALAAEGCELAGWLG